MPLLGDIFGAADAFKRSLADLMRNPLASAQQRLGLLGDQAGAANRDINLLADQNALRMQGSVMADLPQYRQAEDASRARMFNALMNFAPVGATVWHGSPHKFDKFDASKIGTGEGNQSYGHGLYFADAPDVAKTYAIDQRGMSAKAMADKMLTNWGDRKKAVEAMQNRLQKAEQELIPEAVQPYRDALEMLRSGDHTGGGLYKVDLPDEAIAKMLDWDKPLSQQAPEVQKAAQRIFSNLDPSAKKLVGDSLPQLKGAKLYELISSDDSVAGKGAFGAAAASMLRDAGIPGIRYLDGGSRGAGQGTSNYVVFDDSLLKILERNGKPIK